MAHKLYKRSKTPYIFIVEGVFMLAKTSCYCKFITFKIAKIVCQILIKIPKTLYFFKTE
jgi:hypothetical protein